MASVPPNAEPPQGQRWPRDWHAYDNYQVVHQRHIEDLITEGVVTRDALRFVETRTADGRLIRVNLRGRLQTASGGILVVNKWLDVRDARRIEVKTEEYSYHAFVRTPQPRRDLFRYDNSHGGLDTLHRHTFDDEGRELALQAIEHDLLPPLDRVIRETEAQARRLTGPH